jgi:hypothetical protein
MTSPLLAFRRSGQRTIDHGERSRCAYERERAEEEPLGVRARRVSFTVSTPTGSAAMSRHRQDLARLLKEPEERSA